jgi:hypothetical protein
MVSGDPAGRCTACEAPVAEGQRYCLECGSRIGSRSPQLIALLQGIEDRPAADSPRQAAPRPAASGAAAGLTLPPPRFSLLIVLAFLGFGILLGAAAGSSVNGTLAASAAPRVKLVLPPPAAAQRVSTSSSSSSSASGGSSEPPLPEETPTPAETPPATKTGKSSAGSAGNPASTSPAEAQPTGSEKGSSGSHTASRLPPVQHVFVIMLSDQPYASVFGPSSTAHYLSQTLESRGELLVRYDAVAHEQLANGIALLSGQGPTAETAANCPTYADLAPAAVGAQQQVNGHGCVYPAATQTLAGQLAVKHRTWRAYVQGLEAGGSQPACAHPVLGAPDPTAAAGGGYATFRNPFVYFHSVIDSPACRTNDVSLARLTTDLAGSKTTPSFSYIVPDRCHDGSATPCSPGAPAGMTAADGFLRSVVPQILGSKAYKDGGLLVITVDEAPSSGEFADSSSCCGQPHFPNLPSSAPGLSGRGGGAVGALLLSPFVKGATTSQEPYNHFSLLRTIEDLFGLAHLGYAGASGVTPFEPALFSAYAPGH